MKKTAIDLCILGLAIWACLQSPAVNAELHGTITGTTNYVWRAYSKSNNEPAIQANLDYSHDSGFYGGLSVSSFNLGPSEIEFGATSPARLELTPYIGWSFKFFDNWRVDTQYTRYFYDNDIYGKIGDYDEYYLFVHYRDLVTAMVSFADDFYGIDGDTFFFELSGRYPLTDYLQFSTTLGYAKTQEVLADDYEYWNVGLTATYKFLSFDLRYHGARELHIGDLLLAPDHPHTLKDSIVFSISAGF